jgi:chorismate mutase
MKLRRILPLFLLIAAGCRDAAPVAQEPVDALLRLMDERLVVMPDVAKAKSALGLPVDDAKREEALLQAAEVDAAKSGLDVAFVRQFFKAQFEAGKMVQRQTMANYKRPEPSDDGMKRAEQQLEEARAKINRINVQMLTALFNAKNLPSEERRALFADRATSTLGHHGRPVQDIAVAPLLAW